MVKNLDNLLILKNKDVNKCLTLRKSQAMKSEYKNTPESASLRLKAEAKLFRSHFSKTGPLIEADVHKLLHEYEVHMIELEMQNEELRLVADKASNASALYDFAPAGYFALNCSGTISQLNLSGAKLMGKDRSSLLNKNFRQFISPDTLPFFDDFFINVFATNTKQVCDVSLKIGRNPAVYARLEGYVSENDAICLLTVVDITERIEIAESLREVEERYQLLFDTSLDAILLTSPDGSILDVNPSGCKIFERTLAELKQVGRTGIIDTSDPRFVAALEERSRTGKFTGELTFIRKDGTKFPGELCSSVFNDKNGTIRTSMNIRDITKRKQAERTSRESEERYRHVVEQSPNGIAISQDGKLVFLNPSARAMLGGADNQELIGKPILSFVHPESKDKVLKMIELVADGISVLPLEEKLIRLDGRCFIAEIIVLAISFNGRRAGHIIIRDITERRYIEDRLKLSEVFMRELNVSKDKFFSIIAHDLKTPFSAIIGFSNILANQIRSKDYDGIEEYADIIKSSSIRAMSLLMNLYQWTRSQTGNMEFNPETIEIVSLIKEVTELANDSARQKSIAISTELPKTLNVFADKDMISTVLRNLISNAVKFTNLGGKIIISAEQNPTELIVSVCDNGVGIRQDDIEKMWRIDESHTTKGTEKETGTGLGLLLCKEFILKHEGKIWVVGESGKGSTFYFTIPKILILGIGKN